MIRRLSALFLPLIFGLAACDVTPYEPPVDVDKKPRSPVDVDKQPRLAPYTLVTIDGQSFAAGWYDTQLGYRCKDAGRAFGLCEPSVSLDKVYADSACSQPIEAIGEGGRAMRSSEEGTVYGPGERIPNAYAQVGATCARVQFPLYVPVALGHALKWAPERSDVQP